MSEWRRIASGRETVYWNRDLPDGRRLTVGRVYDEHGRPIPYEWRWKLHQARDEQGRNRGVIRAGTVRTVSAGKRAAERVADEVTP